MRTLFIAMVALAACSGRKENCQVALKTFEEGWQKEIDSLSKVDGNDEQVQKMRAALERARQRFIPYCESAPKEDLDCLAKGEAMLGDDKCAHALEAMRGIFTPE